MDNWRNKFKSIGSSIGNSKMLLFLCVFTCIMMISWMIYQEHYASDAYRIMDIGFQEYSKFVLGNGRGIQSFVMYLLSYLPFTYLTMYRIFITITFVLITVCILYVFYLFKHKDHSNNIYILLACISIFIHLTTAETLLFIENVTMWISCLLSLIATKKFCQKKYIQTVVILLFGCLCYQATLSLFIPITYMLVLKENKSMGIHLKEMIKIIICYGISLGINYLMLQGSCYLGFSEAYRISNIDYLFNIQYFAINLICYTLIGCLMIQTMYLLLYKKIKMENQFLIQWHLIMLLCVLAASILTLSNSSKLVIRMMLSIFGMGGIISLFLIQHMNKEQMLTNKKRILFVLLPLLVVNVITYTGYTYISLQTFQLEQKVGNAVKQKVQLYENENNIKITKLAFVYDQKIDMPVIDVANKYYGFFSSWSAAHFFNLMLNREFMIETETNERYQEIQKKFSQYNFTSFCEDEIYIEGETLYFCYY